MGFLHESNRKVIMRKYFKSILFLIVVSIKTNMLSNSSRLVSIPTDSTQVALSIAARRRDECLEQRLNCNNHDEAVKAFYD
jgi:hypothetical protein